MRDELAPGVLAGMCRFVIADISDPRTVPSEVAAIVRGYRIPVVPIIKESQDVVAALEDLEGYSWLLDEVPYSSIEGLVADMNAKVIKPALAAERRILTRRSRRRGMASLPGAAS
jgi:hypothetical protein